MIYKSFVYTYTIARRSKMRKKYINIAVPEDLAITIDDFVKKNKLGFRSRAEFAIEAIRNKLKK